MRGPLRVIVVGRGAAQPPPMAKREDHPESGQRDQKRRSEEPESCKVVNARALVTTIDESVRVAVLGDDRREGSDPDRAGDDEQCDGSCAESSSHPRDRQCATHQREQYEMAYAAH